MKIYIGADQGGIDLKNEIVAHLKENNYDVQDLGI
ncbi:MAG: RpiB/LacA/LacB family sugar-phosphate isomerase, partial [Bacillota bacterium]|nr:RpiB/LacA/LacB family sugar-phosphate isomerase [Bacillota bacterium]